MNLQDKSEPVRLSLQDKSTPEAPQVTVDSEPVRLNLQDKSEPVRLSLQDKSTPEAPQVTAESKPVRFNLQDKSEPVRLSLQDKSTPEAPQVTAESKPVRFNLQDKSKQAYHLEDKSPLVQERQEGMAQPWRMIFPESILPAGFDLSAKITPLHSGMADYVKKKKDEAETWLDCFGWIDQGYTFSFNPATSSSNLPLGFNDQADEYQLNQLYLAMSTKKWVFENEKWSLTGRADLLYGTDHYYTTARGLETRLDGSPRWNSVDPANINRLNATGPAPYYGLALPQAYVDLETPLFGGTEFRMGHFYSPLDTESVMATENFFYSHTFNRIYGKPFTHTGLLATTRMLDDTAAFSAGFTRGWDNFEDEDDDLSILAGFRFELEGNWVSLNVHTGDDHHYLDGTGTPRSGNITVTTLRYKRQLGEKATYMLQGDLGYGEAMQTHDTTGILSEARWYGITNYLLYDFGERISAGTRVEWFRDQDNARVLGIAVDEEVNGGNYVGITGGVHLRPNDRWTVRSELRWDWSDVTSDIYGVEGMFNGQSKRDQFTLTVDAIFTF